MMEDNLIRLDYGCDATSGYPVQSLAIRDRNHTLASLYPAVKFGHVNFKGDQGSKEPFLIRVRPDVDLFGLVECMVMESSMHPPDFILSVVTDPKDPKSFKLLYHREQFIQGMESIMEATAIWIISDGRNKGLVSLIGEAFFRRRESVVYQNKWSESLRKPVDSISNVCLISIVNESDALEHGCNYITWEDEYFQRMMLSVQQQNGSYYINEHYCFHILVDDSQKGCHHGCLDDPAEVFRCRFERHLYTNKVPKLRLKPVERVLRPRELHLSKFRKTKDELQFSFLWKNPYHSAKFRALFECFEMVVYGSSQPFDKDRKILKVVSMKPKRDTMVCTVKFRGTFHGHLFFVVYSKTLHGNSQEAANHIDLSQIPFHTPIVRTDPVFMHMDMYLKCSPSDKDVSIWFTPYLTSICHRVELRDTSKADSYLKRVTLASGVYLCHFTGLTPETEYEVSICPLGEEDKKIVGLSGPFRQKFKTTASKPIPEDVCKISELQEPVKVPMVYLVCGGNVNCIKKILHCLQTRSAAVLVISGTKGAADVVEAAIDSYKEGPTSVSYEIIKDVLRRYVMDEMYKGSEVDSSELERTLACLTEIGMICKKVKRIRTINVWQTKLNLAKISKEYLKCWILCGGRKEKSQTAFERDVKLAIDLNNANVAQDEIFEQPKYKNKSITNELFELALLTKDREKFVDLFLEYGFQVHKYLTEDRLKYIFEYEDERDPYDRDFFITTTVEGILGLTGDEDKLPDDFVSKELPRVIERLTGLQMSFINNDTRILFVPIDEEESHPGVQFVDISTAYITIKGRRLKAMERDSLKSLIVYAVLMNRNTLATYIWKHSTSPLLTALFCAALYQRLKNYCHESYQQILASKCSSRFTDLAVKLLDLTFIENEQITHESLQSKYADWNDRSPIEFAHGVDNKDFMAHPSCQKWVTRTYFGEITLRDMTTYLWPVPKFIKILACALLVFPMYAWVNFSPIGKANSQEPKSKVKVSIDFSQIHEQEKKPAKHEFQCLKTPDVCPRQSKSSLLHKLSIFTSGTDQSEQIALSQDVMSNEYFWPRSTLESLHRRRQIFQTRIAMSPPFWKKLMLFWGAPVTKFTMDAFLYAIYLALFSLVTIWPTCGNILLDLVFWMWSASIAFEHTRLCYTKSKTINHLPLELSIIDIIIQTIFLIGFVRIRIYGLWEGKGVSPQGAKSFLGVFLIYYFLRVFKLYYPIHPKLGPAMVKLTYMITDDFVSYMYVFIIFMIPTGIAVTAIIFPHHPLDFDIFTKVLKRGIMALFRTDTRDLERIDASLCHMNLTRDSCVLLSSGISFSYDDDHMYSVFGIENRKCSIATWIVWVMVLEYGYMSNVFLRSLLTAMFGITGRNVSAISEQIWMYDRYEIIMDYERKPRLPPPFCVISYALAGFAHIYKNFIRPDLFKVHSSDGGPLVKKARIETDSFAEFVSMITEFTRGDTSTWTDEHRWKEDRTNIYWKLKAEKVLEMTTQKDKTSQTLKLLNLKSDIVQRVALESRNADSFMRRMLTEAMIRQTNSIGSSQFQEALQQERLTHWRARMSPYPKTSTSRCPVSDANVPWTVPMEDYKPPTICVDVDQTLFKRSTSEDLPKVEKREEDDLQSFRNPAGRTGVGGRGCLFKLGVNRFVIAVVTRQRSKNLVEFLFEDKANDLETSGVMDWTRLPMASSVNGQSSPYAAICQQLDAALSERIEGESGLHGASMMLEFVTKAVARANSELKPIAANVYNGYLDDPRNTDNAWIEIEAWNYNIKCQDINLFPNNGFKWLPMTKSCPILAGLEPVVDRILLLAM